MCSKWPAGLALQYAGAFLLHPGRARISESRRGSRYTEHVEILLFRPTTPHFAITKCVSLALPNPYWKRRYGLTTVIVIWSV